LLHIDAAREEIANPSFSNKINYCENQNIDILKNIVKEKNSRIICKINACITTCRWLIPVILIASIDSESMLSTV
jgi:hypothetical protein